MPNSALSKNINIGFAFFKPGSCSCGKLFSFSLVFITVIFFLESSSLGWGIFLFFFLTKKTIAKTTAVINTTPPIIIPIITPVDIPPLDDGELFKFGISSLEESVIIGSSLAYVESIIFVSG